MHFLTWHLMGFLGQGIFASRFLVQWLQSERSHQSVIPPYFWYSSLVGGVLMLVYAIHIKDPVFTMGQSFGVLVYLRNLKLRRKTPDGTPENA